MLISTLDSNGWWIVETLERDSICTCYFDDASIVVKQIVKDHNEQLKAKKALAKTPFAK